MRYRTFLLKTIVGAGLIAGLGTGCGVELGGKEGNLNFHYKNADYESGVKTGAIAVGAKVDVEVRQPGEKVALTISEAFSESADIIDVVAQKSTHFTLEALEAGEAEIGVKARAGSSSVEDSVDITSAELKEIVFNDHCKDSIFLTGSKAQFSYRMRDEAGKRLTGYGLYPVEVEPAEGGAVDESFDQLGLMAIKAGDEPGEYELTSELSERSLSFTLIDPSDITAVELAGGDEAEGEEEEIHRQVVIGEEVAVALFTMEAADRQVCGSAEHALELSTSTPEICAPSYRFLSALHLIYVEGLEAGECEVSLSIPGTEFEQEFKVDIM